MNREPERLFQRWIEHVAASIEMELRVEEALRSIREQVIETEQPQLTLTTGGTRWRS